MRYLGSVIKGGASPSAPFYFLIAKMWLELKIRQQAKGGGIAI